MLRAGVQLSLSALGEVFVITKYSYFHVCELRSYTFCLGKIDVLQNQKGKGRGVGFGFYSLPK